MRIAICDDDMREHEQFEMALSGLDFSPKAENYTSGAELLEAAKKAPPFDMVFLDIYMPGENGINIAESLREISPETGIVFVTVSREHALEAFSLHAIHYLLKPVTTEGIAETIRRFMKLRKENRQSITLTAGTDRYTVFLDRICLLESDNHSVNVSLADGQKIKVSMSFGELEKKMNENFLKINRGIIVNMDYIAQMRTDVCVLQSGIRLPIAIRRKAAVRAAYDSYVFERLSRRGKFGGD